MYPNAGYSGTLYDVDVYTGNRRDDHKSQSYPPHGSVTAAIAAKYSGQILKISGDVFKGTQKVLVYQLECHIA